MVYYKKISVKINGPVVLNLLTFRANYLFLIKLGKRSLIFHFTRTHDIGSVLAI